MDLEKLEQETEALQRAAYGDNPEDDTTINDTLEPEDEDTTPGPPPEDFEQKYKTLQGKYTAELDRMNNLLSSTLSERERLAAQLESTRTPQLADPGNDETTRFIDELQSEYPTIAKGVEAMLKRDVRDRMAKTEGAVENLTRATDQVVADRYLSSLDSIMPSWRQIKDNPDFSKWLAQPDRYTGATRFQLLSGADSQRNPQTVAAFYEDFAREAGLLSDDGGTPAPSRSAPTTQNISPTTTGNPAPSTQSKGFITRDEITKFYRDRALGKFSGSDEDAAKVEGRIMKAVREGKVR